MGQYILYIVIYDYIYFNYYYNLLLLLSSFCVMELALPTFVKAEALRFMLACTDDIVPQITARNNHENSTSPSFHNQTLIHKQATSC